MNKLRIVVLTQEDYFFIPKNIKKVAQEADIKEIVILDTKGSLNNKTTQFIKWFGIFQISKMAFKVVVRKIENVIDLILNHSILKGEGSIKMVAHKLKIACKIEKRIDSDDFYKHISAINPDLIISYSCPVVLKEKLLDLPKYGIINVHGSYLPNYQGLLPSFWHLRYKEKYAGATVHYMSKKIDDGDIILQEKLDISNFRTMFEVMRATKLVGGDLMLQALKQIASGNSQRKPNKTEEGKYFSWPKNEDVKIFKSNGFKFV